MFMKPVFMFCLIILFGSGVLVRGDKNKENNEEDETFVPTNEWKEIKKDQVVPSGFHYRINLQTGKKEVKILSESEQDLDNNHKNSLINVNNEEKVAEEKSKTKTKIFEPGKLKEKLKKIKGDYLTPKQDSSKNVFRTYEELKKDMMKLNLNSKTESELLKDLLEEYKQEISKKPPDQEILLEILEDLNYLSHQYDNAQDFVKLDGFSIIIYRNLNSSSVELQEAALRLFSSLVQNNAKVKIHALETGALPFLLRILSSDISEQVQLRAVTALSCLLRTFPFAQNEFLEKGGLSIISDTFKSDSVKLRSKLATLMTDLLDERTKDKQNFENHKFIDLENHLLQINWCEHLNDLLKDLYVIDSEDHDSLEKCLHSLQSVKKHCHKSYNKNLLLNMYKNYKELAEEDDSEYFNSLSKLCSSLGQVKEMYTKSEL